LFNKNYVGIKKRELTTSILGKRKSITIKEMNKLEPDIRKQNHAIVPNIVHSFDASNISLLVKNLSNNFTENNFNLLTIHDCFATNANNVDKMTFNVKLAFIALYLDKSFIDSYHSFILDFIIKTGYLIDKENSNNETISYIVTTEGRIKIPNKPYFTINKDLKLSILGSQYFII
jgi:DNA-directed RNA polymerase